MGEITGCVVEKITGANNGSNRATFEVIKLIKNSRVNEEGSYILGCEACGSELAISLELSNHSRLLLDKEPLDPDQACSVVTNKRAKDWVTNMRSDWFNVAWIHRNESDEDRQSSSEDSPILSPYGLEIVLNQAAEELDRLKQVDGTRNIESLENQRRIASYESLTNTLSLVVYRPDGRSWQEIIEEINQPKGKTQ